MSELASSSFNMSELASSSFNTAPPGTAAPSVSEEAQ
jgi:hypothetical protein